MTNKLAIEALKKISDNVYIYERAQIRDVTNSAIAALSAEEDEPAAWVSVKDRLPDTKPDTEVEFIVACRRAHNGETYVFAAEWLNRKLLLVDDDDCPEDGMPFTGWYKQQRDDGDYDDAWHPVCSDGDEITHWMPLPPAPLKQGDGK